jgi:hypothetical protein
MDRIVIERQAQPPADFQGLMMNFLAVLHVPWRDLADRRPYTEHKVSAARDSPSMRENPSTSSSRHRATSM